MDKKRIIRRLLSLFVSVAMVLVYIPQIAFADDGNEDDEIFKLFSIRDWEAQYNEQFVYYGGQVCILWDGKDKYYPKETELQQPEEGVDEDGEYYYQSGICSTLIPNDAEYIEIIMVPDDNFEPKLRIVDASSNGEFVEGIEYDEDYGGYVYKYEITDENTGISNAEQTGGVDFYPEFLYEEEDDWIQPQDGTILDLGNISPTYDENEYEYYYYENDGTIYLTKGGSMEIFFDNRKYNPNKTHEYNYVYDEQDDPIECNCQTRIPVGTKKVQIRLHPKDKHYIPKVKLFDATKNGEYDDSVEYNESLGCYVYEYELNEKNLGGNEENPYGKVGFSCEFNFQPTTTLFGICGLVDSDIQDKIKVKRGKMELYWNGDIKYTVSDNDFWKKYYYEYDGSTILDGEEHLMELPKNTTSIVMRVYPKQGYIPAFRVFDASTQSEEGKVLTGEYNEKDGYYELVYKITDDCIYNNDGSLNGYIRISPEYNFDSSFADDLSGMVYFDNSQVK